MRKAMLTLLLAVLSSSAMAELTKWIFVSRQEAFIIYADTATIRKAGSIAQMWDLADAKAGKAFGGVKKTLSFKMEREYDCGNQQLRLLYISWYSGNMGAGEITGSNADPSDWRPVLPGTEGERFWQIACGVQTGRGL